MKSLEYRIGDLNKNLTNGTREGSERFCWKLDVEYHKYIIAHIINHAHVSVAIERLHLHHNHDVKQLPCGKIYTLYNGVSSTFCCSSAVCYFSNTNCIQLIVRWLGKTIAKDN